MALAALPGLVGCGAGDKSEPIAKALGPAPTYEAIAVRQNARLEPIERYRSRASFEIKWTDEEGEEHTEVGDGTVMFIRPNRTALTFEKLGKIYFWAGNDAERFWLFEGGDDSRAYVARNENAFRKCAEALPLSVHPLELLDLFGMFEFPASTESWTPSVEPDKDGGAWVVSIPGEWSVRRVYLDADQLWPVRIELIEYETGRLLATSELVDYQPMNITDLPPAYLPEVPTRFYLEDKLNGGYFRVTPRNPADSGPGGDFREQAFVFEAVRGSMRPERIIVLDENCPNPALASSERDTSNVTSSIDDR